MNLPALQATDKGGRPRTTDPFIIGAPPFTRVVYQRRGAALPKLRNAVGFLTLYRGGGAVHARIIRGCDGTAVSQIFATTVSHTSVLIEVFRRQGTTCDGNSHQVSRGVASDHESALA